MIPMETTNAAQTVDEIYSAFGRGDVGFIVDKCADDVQWRTNHAAQVPWQGPYDGKQHVGRFFMEIMEAVDVLGFEPRLVVADQHTVVSEGTFACRSKKTGRETNSKWVFIWKFRDGKVASYEQFHDSAIATIFD